MKLPTNRFLRTSDFQNDHELESLKKDIDLYYQNTWHGTPHTWGAKNPQDVITHWSREWEYAWVIRNGCFKEGDKVLDCGCGGSPLLPYLVEKRKCIGYGVDFNHGSQIIYDKPDIEQQVCLANLRYYFIDPHYVVKENLYIEQGDISCLSYDDNYFDKVMCISVLEHLDEDVGKKSLIQMKRVLKPGGKLIITLDHNSYNGHVKEWCEGKFMDIIESTGLELVEDSNFEIPGSEDVDGEYNVVGFILEK